MKNMFLWIQGIIYFFCISTAFAENERQEWCDESVTNVNREPAYMVNIPFSSVKEAIKFPMECSPYYLSLNGIWKFNWVSDPELRPKDFYLTDYNTESWDSINVPSNWQIEAVRNHKKWDKPLYCNIIYPFTVTEKKNIQTPNVIQPRPANYTFASMVNPVGSYRREFIVPQAWKNRDVYIRFNGVEAGFYLWINGKKVGYSEDSYLPAEFNITSYLNKSGKNVLAVEVYRFTDGSFLECQDFWRLSGIFRDVFLWSAPKTQIRDYFFQADLDEKYQDAVVSLDVNIQGPKKNNNLWVSLLDHQGKEVFSRQYLAKKGNNRLVFSVKNPLKWTGETPYLYDLVLQLKEKGISTDIRSSKVGFRKIEIANDGRFLINGRSILFKGANRHDHSPENGRSVSFEETEKDIQLMKSFNINAIRTSHYPNNPYFYDLCDKYGIYVLSEANVECHGLMSLSDSSTWCNAFTERVENMVRRYRNHPSIVIWSLGNEAGRGVNHVYSEKAVKKNDSTRPSHYVGNKGYCDMSSSMYTPLDVMIKIGEERLKMTKSGQVVRPHLHSEFAHAMGNAIGNLREFWETYEKYPALIGGFIWDWVDQGIRMPSPNGKGSYMAVGGDFGDIPNDGNFCTNGIVFANRTYSAKALQVKKIFQPVAVEHIDGNRIKIINKRFFTDLSDLYARYYLLEDGVVIFSNDLGQLDIAPQADKCFDLSLPNFERRKGAVYDLNFRFYQKEDTYWEKADYEVASEQIRFEKAKEYPILEASIGSLVLKEDGDTISVCGANFVASFSKKQGTLSSYRIKGIDVIEKGPKMNLFRAPTDNDKLLLDEWYEKRMHDLSLVKGDWNVTQKDGKILLTISNQYEGKDSLAYKNKVEYAVHSNGAIAVTSHFIPAYDKIRLPRIGFKLYMPKGFERMRWLGRGPFENYLDRKDAAFIGLYDDFVSNQYVPYIRPQVMGVREDVSWVTLTNKEGFGLMFIGNDGLSFSALHYDDLDLVDVSHPGKLVHTYEIQEREETVLCIDAKHAALGNGSCGDIPLDKYDLLSEPLTFKFIIMPVVKGEDTSDLLFKGRMRIK